MTEPRMGDHSGDCQCAICQEAKTQQAKEIEDLLRLGNQVELQKVLQQVQLQWKFNLTTGNLVLMWKANDGEHNYGAAVEIDSQTVCKIVRGLVYTAQGTIQKLGKELRPGFLEPHSGD